MFPTNKNIFTYFHTVSNAILQFEFNSRLKQKPPKKTFRWLRRADALFCALRFTETAVAEIQVKTATAAGLGNEKTPSSQNRIRSAANR
jgi:hypothetical protein